MIVLQARALAKSFGVQKIFENVNIVIEEKEKIGLVGPNGAGKTTLMCCLTGKEAADAGEIVFAESVNAGYMEQIPDYKSGVTLFEAILDSFSDILALREKLTQLEHFMSEQEGSALAQAMANYARVTEEYERAGGFSCEAMTRRIAVGLGFQERDLAREVAEFSGGEKTKVSLARLLVRKPELLLLDEPTNHLDLAAVEWLESFLKSYLGSLLVISHDRYFLDQITQRTLELENRTLTSYAGNYSRYVALKEEKTLEQSRSYEKQRKFIAQTEEYIDKYRAGIKSKQARGRQSQLERLERIDGPVAQRSINIKKSAYQAAESANIVIDVRDVMMSFGENLLWDKISISIGKNEKVALIGSNGTGKTTLFKIITGELQPSCGSVKIGSRVKVGYFDQEHRSLDPNNRILDEVMSNTALNPTEARDILGSFLFRGDDVFKVVRDLSGGEKGRLAFLKLLQAKPNLLLLDEPTNHLDIASRLVIEDYLQQFLGAVLVISHDRYFLDKTTQRTLELEGAGLTDYRGNYTYCREQKARQKKASEQPAEEIAEKNKTPKNKAESNKDEVRTKINKAQTRETIAALEKDIEKMEERLDELSSILAEGSTYQDEATARGFLAEYKELEQKIPATYGEWEKLHELLAGS